MEISESYCKRYPVNDKKSQSQKAWDEAGEKKESEKREKIDLSQFETLANFDEESFDIKPTKVDIQKNLYLLLKYNEVELKDVKKKYRYLAVSLGFRINLFSVFFKHGLITGQFYP